MGHCGCVGDDPEESEEIGAMELRITPSEHRTRDEARAAAIKAAAETEVTIRERQRRARGGD